MLFTYYAKNRHIVNLRFFFFFTFFTSMDVVLQWYAHVNIACTQHVELKSKKNVSLDLGCVSRFASMGIALLVLCACYWDRGS